MNKGCYVCYVFFSLSTTAMGAEVVAGDIDDMESLKTALQGAYGAYFVTFFWAHFSPEKEIGEARNMAQAAKEAGSKHVIWSTLEDTRKFVSLDDNRMPTLQGKYKVPHFDAKGEADEFFRRAGVPTTFLVASFYLDNLIYFPSPKLWRSLSRLGTRIPKSSFDEMKLITALTHIALLPIAILAVGLSLELCAGEAGASPVGRIRLFTTENCVSEWGREASSASTARIEQACKTAPCKVGLFSRIIRHALTLG